MTEEIIKRNIEVINNYFQSMQKLYSDIDYFISECKTVIKQDGNIVKIYGLAYNLAWSLRYTMKLMVEYEKILQNSLLYDYWKENQEEAEKFNDISEELVSFIKKSLDTISIEITGRDVINPQLFNDSAEEELNLIIENDQYFLSLCDDLACNGPRILHLIVIYLQATYKLLIEIRNIRLSRNDTDYELLFEREFKEYLSTDAWNDFEECYINSTINNRYSGLEPSEEQLWKMRDNEYDRLMDLRKDLGDFEAYLSDPRKLARYLVDKEIKYNVNNPILELFGIKGRLKLIDQWIEDLREEAPLMEAFESSESSDVIRFTERLSEKRLISLWPKIEKLYVGRKAIDWACLYHVLVYRNYISCDDFKVFAYWLNKTANKTVISESNIRQIKMSYWIKEAKHVWTIEGFRKWRNSAKADSIYKDYEQLCHDINEIIK